MSRLVDRRSLMAAGAASLLLMLAATPVSAQRSASAPAAWVEDLSPIGLQDWNYDRAAHLLERAGFGGTPEEIEKLAAMTPAQAVDYLVDYKKLDNSFLKPF